MKNPDPPWGPENGPKTPRTCNYINPYHPILAPPKKCKNVHFLGSKNGVIFTRALFTRLFYLYFWQTGGDIFGKGEKTAPRGHFSTFFPVLAGVMGLSTPHFGGLKDGFFGPKNPKNGPVFDHPYDPEKWSFFDKKMTIRGLGFFLRVGPVFFHGFFGIFDGHLGSSSGAGIPKSFVSASQNFWIIIV